MWLKVVSACVLLTVSQAATNYPKSVAKMGKLVSSALTEDILNCGFDRFYLAVKGKRSFKNATDDIIANCKSKLLSQSQFIGPAMSLSTKLHNTTAFVDEVVVALESQWKGFFITVKKLNIKTPSQFDNKLSSKIITKPNIKNVFKAIKKKVSSADWKSLVSTFGGVLNFSRFGF
ncbi:unnamed protein product [Bursaphelenchus xylophilus]|uniref:(pine wood nematode) hypothetical protein n=1 Tax=Bursaphelenchus xylophilus TaxID=6326 RepID=A0A1I7S455_BURXY|nr:unnamed protein product [Bursaphelenchus xylophilus]CAG9116739.1 unnamed protein product [Bursaphelenchus xylophilus]